MSFLRKFRNWEQVDEFGDGQVVFTEREPADVLFLERRGLPPEACAIGALALQAGAWGLANLHLARGRWRDAMAELNAAEPLDYAEALLHRQHRPLDVC